MIIDLFAGPGGWDEGLRMIGRHDVIGVEWERWACATARAAGHKRARGDVSHLDPSRLGIGPVEGLIASPPCQAWSMAGRRGGEEDRAACHELVDRMAAGDDSTDWREWTDDRSPLVAQPVRWVRELRPEWVTLEEVPAVLGLWEHIARIFRGWGYSTWVGVLNAADYGVPQTRKRAIVIASRIHGVAKPDPTHSIRGGGDLFGAGKSQWVSMADALALGSRSPERWLRGSNQAHAALRQQGREGAGWATGGCTPRSCGTLGTELGSSGLSEDVRGEQGWNGIPDLFVLLSARPLPRVVGGEGLQDSRLLDGDAHRSCGVLSAGLGAVAGCGYHIGTEGADDGCGRSFEVPAHVVGAVSKQEGWGRFAFIVRPLRAARAIHPTHRATHGAVPGLRKEPAMPLDSDDMTLTIPPAAYEAMQTQLRANIVGRREPDELDLLQMLGLAPYPRPCGVHASGQRCERLAGHDGKHRWAR